MYNRNNLAKTEEEKLSPLDKRKKKDYTENKIISMQSSAFDDDALADSAIEYLYTPANQNKTQSFLKGNSFPTMQERALNQQMYGQHEEKKHMRDLFKTTSHGIIKPDLDERDLSFLQGMMGDEDGEKEYQKMLSDANRRRSALYDAFQGSQFERLLSPTSSVDVYTRSRTLSATTPGNRSILDPLREYNTTQYFGTKTIPANKQNKEKSNNEAYGDKIKTSKSDAKEKNWIYDAWNYADDVTWKTAALGVKAIGWELTSDLLWLAASGSGNTYYAPPGSYASDLAKNDSGINKFVNEVIWTFGTSQNNPNPKIPTQNYEIPLSNGDLGAALHNVKLDIDANRDSNGVWTATVTLSDTFDFTEFKNPFKQESIKKGLLWFANDIAYYDTKWGLLDPVEVSITYQKNF